MRAPCCFDGLLRTVLQKNKGVFGLFRGPVTGRCDEQVRSCGVFLDNYRGDATVFELRD